MESSNLFDSCSNCQRFKTMFRLLAILALIGCVVGKSGEVNVLKYQDRFLGESVELMLNMTSSEIEVLKAILDRSNEFKDVREALIALKGLNVDAYDKVIKYHQECQKKLKALREDVRKFVTELIRVNKKLDKFSGKPVSAKLRIRVRALFFDKYKALPAEAKAEFETIFPDDYKIVHMIYALFEKYNSLPAEDKAEVKRTNPGLYNILHSESVVQLID